MCGRFTQAYTWQELVALYRLTVPAINLQPRYNIAPTTTIDVFASHEASLFRSALVSRLTQVQANSFVQVIGVGYAFSQSQCSDRHDDEASNANQAHCCPNAARGRTILNSVNSPGCVSTSIDPPCCLTMMS
jgi:hypothetical protein